MSLLVIFCAGFASVFLLGFQSRNVNEGHYTWAAATSFVIAIAQVGLWGALLRDLTWQGAVTYGVSGALGIVSAMKAHGRFVRKVRK